MCDFEHGSILNISGKVNQMIFVLEIKGCGKIPNQFFPLHILW